jgi:NAD(P)-dependent dehydrogenase (short-subunit alcohol dehydrogenase family)
MLAKARNARALKRDEQAEDLVGTVFFLASPDADFLTGQIINVDGGSHMH